MCVFVLKEVESFYIRLNIRPPFMRLWSDASMLLCSYASILLFV
jgi:hypothetical protein